MESLSDTEMAPLLELAGAPAFQRAESAAATSPNMRRSAVGDDAQTPAGSPARPAAESRAQTPTRTPTRGEFDGNGSGFAPDAALTPATSHVRRRLLTPPRSAAAGSSAPLAAIHAPQGTLCVTSSDDCTVRVWDVNRSPKEMDPPAAWYLEGHTCRVLVLLHLTGRLLLSGDESGRVVIWDALAGAILQDLSGRETGAKRVFSAAAWRIGGGAADGERLAVATGHDGGRVRLWWFAAPPGGASASSRRGGLGSDASGVSAPSSPGKNASSPDRAGNGSERDASDLTAAEASVIRRRAEHRRPPLTPPRGTPTRGAPGPVSPLLSQRRGAGLGAAAGSSDGLAEAQAQAALRPLVPAPLEPLLGHAGEEDVLALASVELPERSAQSCGGVARPRRVLASAAGAEILLWEETHGAEPAGRLDGHVDDVRALAAGPAGSGQLLSVGVDGGVRLWCLQALACLCCVEDAHMGAPVVAAALLGGAGDASSAEAALLARLTASGGGGEEPRPRFATSGGDCCVRVWAWDSVRGTLVEESEDRPLKAERRDGGEAAFVLALASADAEGDALLAPCDDGTLRALSTAARAEVGALRAHADTALCAAVVPPAPGPNPALAPCGALVSASTADGSVLTWDARSGELRSRADLSARVTAVCDAGCGRVAVGDESGRLSVVSADTGELLLQVDTLSGRISALAAVCGGRAATGHGCGAVRLWNLLDGEPACDGRLSHLGEGVCALCFVALPHAAAQPPGAAAGAAPRFLLASSDSGVGAAGKPTPIRLWDVDAAAVAPGLPLTGHEAPVRAMCALGGGRLLAADHCSLRAWDARTRLPLFSVRNASPEPLVALAALSPVAAWGAAGAPVAATADACGGVVLWEWADGPKPTLRPQQANAAAAEQQQQTQPFLLAPLITADERRRMSVRGGETDGAAAALRGISASSDGLLLASAERHGPWRLLEGSAAPRELSSARPPAAADSLAGPLAAVSPPAAGCLGVAAGADGYLRAFRLSDGQVERTLRIDSATSPTGTVAFTCVAHLSGALVAAAGDEGRLHLVNLETGARAAANAGSRLTTALVVLRDGTLASGHGDGALRLWAAAEAPLRLQQAPGRPYLEAPNGAHRDSPVEALCCVPLLGRAGGPPLERLVSLCGGSVFVWDAAARKHVSTLRLPVDVVSVAPLGPSRLLCLGADDTLLAWGLPEKDLLCPPVPAASFRGSDDGIERGGWADGICALPGEPQGRFAVAERTPDGAAVFTVWGWDSGAEELARLPGAPPLWAAAPVGPAAAASSAAGDGSPGSGSGDPWPPPRRETANGAHHSAKGRVQYAGLGREQSDRLIMAVSPLHPQLLLAATGGGGDADEASGTESLWGEPSSVAVWDAWSGAKLTQAVVARGGLEGVTCLCIVPQPQWR